MKCFSKLFADETQISDDSYPIYYRYNDSQFVIRTICRQKICFDNYFVVFYNLYLTYKYNVHINIEIYIIVKIVKYIYKYIYKRSDKTTVEIQRQNRLNKVEIHLQTRYISFTKAVVQLFEFPIYKEFPPVI